MFPVDDPIPGSAPRGVSAWLRTTISPRCRYRLRSRALEEEHGDVLVFLPGPGRNTSRTAHCSKSVQLPRGMRVLPLYGELPVEQQDAAIRPSTAGERKIVLATNIAETSLTIEGVRIVIDSGYARRARFDPATGMSRLETMRISRASADQRRGRAGRLEAGVCYRLWSEAEHASLTHRRRRRFSKPILRHSHWSLPAGVSAIRVHCAGSIRRPPRASRRRAIC